MLTFRVVVGFFYDFFFKICFTYESWINNKRRNHILTIDKNGLNEMSDFKDFVAKSLDDDKALDIEVINLTNQSAIADYIVIASGTSSMHVKGMAEKLKDRLNGRGIKNIKTEGASIGDWVVIDAGDIVVHLFRPEVREFYNIEKMWNMGNTPTSPHTDAQHA